MNKKFLYKLKKLVLKAKSGDKKSLEIIEDFLRNPRLETDEYYEVDNSTGLASIDIPHKKYFKKGVLEAKYPKMKMYDYLYLRNKDRLYLDALNFYGNKITFLELFDNIEKTAKGFKGLGVKEGDYVVISMPTTPEAVYMLFALNRLGAIPIELDPRVGKDEITDIIKESGSNLYITMEDCCPVIDDIMNNDDSIRRQLSNVMFVSPTESLPFVLNGLSNLKDKIDRKKGNKPVVSDNPKYISWDKFIEDGKYMEIIDSPYKENTTAEIIFSSGTTSKPKPIMYTNETFTSMVRQIELGENAYKPGDKNLDIIPMFLGFGSNNGLYTILCNGVEDILMPVPVTDDLPKLIEKYKPNHLLGAPVHMNLLLKYLEENPSKMRDLSFIKSIVSGSAFLESARQYKLDEALMSRGCKIKVGPGYGQNEGGPTLSFSPDTFLEMRKPGCSGYPLPGTTISIFDQDTDEELPYGQDLEGEVRYMGPCVMKGYAFNKLDENNKFFKKDKDGRVWCCSGDLGKIDSDGGIYITGRIARQLHHNGFKFSPTEIEELIIDKVPFVSECALIGKEDEIEESIPVLFYSVKEQYKENSELVKDSIVECCSGLKDYKKPMEYVELDKLPLTPNLKIDFKKLESEVNNKKLVKIRK